MLAKYNARLRGKNAVEMQGVASFLSAIGVLDKQAFLREYTTTIGRSIYAPFSPGVAGPGWNLWSQVVVCAHEFQHIVQYNKGGFFGYYLPYVFRRAKRTAFETEAYRSALELSYWRFGTMPSAHTIAQMLGGYGVSATDIRVAETALKMSALSIGRGAIINEASRAVVDWLENHAPEMRELR